MSQAQGIGIIGCGTIATQYAGTLKRLPLLDLIAVADLEPSRAKAFAAVHGTKAVPVSELLADPSIATVLNLTVPAAHAEVAIEILTAGKHVYCEKPIATSTADAHRILAVAENAGLRVGCAPDTVLGSGIQTARKAIDDGLIGQPVAATATMVTPGHETWHHQPDFYYQPGGGPLYDMGPYYLSALVHMLGPVSSVIGASSRSRDSRVIATGPRAGQPIPVGVDTHVTGVLTHASGALSTIVMSFDAVDTAAAKLEVHGQDGSLIVPDPNHFDGDVLLKPNGAAQWSTLAPAAGFLGGGRGIGLIGQDRASGKLALHILDIMESVLRAAASGRAQPIEHQAERPLAVPFSVLRR
ncbi:Gfo/Idh/MocA family protein [Catelliglobosispora koreensis]|uniref:Gfo/Idh/MocA family protein n=1 Tax=Catelliglobosispora koreensis TaxID=129052 RepID=UPI00036E4ED8|nr:Gfo/Idh/MocA family oxidoreductase [Catelliglobosispora koreensis]